jgi:hypothetical protein
MSWRWSLRTRHFDSSRVNGCIAEGIGWSGDSRTPGRADCFDQDDLISVQ